MLLLEIVLVLLVFLAVGCVFMLYRNRWTCRELLAELDRNPIEFHKYWSYEKVLWRVWVWNIKKMRDA